MEKWFSQNEHKIVRLHLLKTVDVLFISGSEWIVQRRFFLIPLWHNKPKQNILGKFWFYKSISSSTICCYLPFFFSAFSLCALKTQCIHVQTTNYTSTFSMLICYHILFVLVLIFVDWRSMRARVILSANQLCDVLLLLLFCFFFASFHIARIAYTTL